MINEGVEEVQTVDERGNPSDRRVQSVAAARAILSRCDDADDQDAERRARLRGHANGNPPYDPIRLQELGLGYLTNTNFLEMRCELNKKAATSFELLFEVPTLVTFTQRVDFDSQQPQEDYGHVVSEEFTRMLMDWFGFLSAMNTIRREADLIGYGPVLFPDQFDWRFEAVKSGSLRVPPKASLDVSKWPYCFVKHELRVADLFNTVLSNPDAAQEEGWNIPALKRLLKYFYLSAGGNACTLERYRTTKWEEIELRARSKDFTFEASQFDDIPVTFMLVSEADGAVSQLIFPDDPVVPEKAEGMDEFRDEFIFEGVRMYPSMDRVVWVLPGDGGDGGSLKACRGLATMLEPHCDLSNRFLGRMHDAGFISSSLLLQPQTPGDVKKLSLIRAGAVTIIPPGVNAIQSSFSPPISGLVQLRDVSSAIMRNNTGIYRQNPESQANRGEKTARQVVEETSKEVRAEKADIAFDYVFYERLYREVFRRVTNVDYLQSEVPWPGQAEARDFIRACIRRGVPAQLLVTPGAFELKVSRAIGLGSLGVRMDVTNQVLGARNLMDEQGQVMAFREWLAARVGYANVDRFKPLRNRDEIPSNEHSIAALENNDFVEGRQVPVGSDQFHAIHEKVHASLIDSIGQMLQQANGDASQLDLPSLKSTLEAVIPHYTGHLQYLSQDPLREPIVQQASQRLAQAKKVYGLIVQLVEAQAKQAQAASQQRMDQERQRGFMEGSETYRLKLFEIMEKMRLKEINDQMQNALREKKTAEQMRIKGEATAAGLRMKAAVESVKLESQRAPARE